MEKVRRWIRCATYVHRVCGWCVDGIFGVIVESLTFSTIRIYSKVTSQCSPRPWRFAWVEGGTCVCPSPRGQSTGCGPPSAPIPPCGVVVRGWIAPSPGPGPGPAFASNETRRCTCWKGVTKDVFWKEYEGYAFFKWAILIQRHQQQRCWWL